MAIAVLVSDEIYNFSELLEQPLLISLKNSPYAWMYELLEIFNRGDIQKFKQVSIQHVLLLLFRRNFFEIKLNCNKKLD